VDALLLCLDLPMWRPVVLATHTINGVVILAPEMAVGRESFYRDTARKVRSAGLVPSVVARNRGFVGGFFFVLGYALYERMHGPMV
jgi:hypothetical protein